MKSISFNANSNNGMSGNVLQQPVDPIYDDDESNAGDEGHDWCWEMNQKSHTWSPNWATFLNLRLSTSYIFFAILRIRSRASQMLGKSPATEPHP